MAQVGATSEQDVRTFDILHSDSRLQRRPTLRVTRVDLRAKIDKQLDHPQQTAKAGRSERAAAEQAVRHFGVRICAGPEEDTEGIVVVAVDCVQDCSAAADIHCVQGGAPLDQKPHVRQLGQGRGPVKRGAAHGVLDTDGVRVAVKLSPERLEGSANDDIMDQGKLLLLDPVLACVCPRWVQCDTSKLGQLRGTAFLAICIIPRVLIRTRLGGC